ncbi:uncharacterized protein AB9W97_014255 isoform 2-T3 [Spinachia spinachia]
MTAQVGLLSNQVEQILTLLSGIPAAAPEQPSTSPSPSPSALHADTCTRLAPPERCSGTFGQKRSKVAFMLSNLSGRAKAWASDEWARNSTICTSPKRFADALKLVFDPETTDRETAQELRWMRQEKETIRADPGPPGSAGPSPAWVQVYCHNAGFFSGSLADRITGA